MKKLTFAGVLLIGSIAISASGQAKSGITVNNHPRSIAAGTRVVSAMTRARVKARSTRPASGNEEIAGLSGSPPNSKFAPVWGNAALNPSADSSRPRKSRPANPNSNTALSGVAVAPALTNIYRIGVGDVLDVQLLQNPTNKSTLYTVLEGGVVDYPLASQPVSVAGLTSAEVAARLRQQIKVFKNPAVVVDVRDYASHNVTISGLVGAPGAKVLRREAVPLCVVLSQSLLFAEATRATITRRGSLPIIVELGDANDSATLVRPGDLIKVSAEPLEFFFARGAINVPGQKPHHASLTPTQAILASAGLSENAGAKVKLSRQGANGHLFITSEYNLRNIQSGKALDPIFQKGDSLEVEARR